MTTSRGFQIDRGELRSLRSQLDQARVVARLAQMMSVLGVRVDVAPHKATSRIGGLAVNELVSAFGRFVDDDSRVFSFHHLERRYRSLSVGSPADRGRRDGGLEAVRAGVEQIKGNWLGLRHNVTGHANSVAAKRYLRGKKSRGKAFVPNLEEARQVLALLHEGLHLVCEVSGYRPSCRRDFSVIETTTRLFLPATTGQTDRAICELFMLNAASDDWEFS